jgi:uncharacterized protein YbjT (DUF2867 family)
MAYSSSLSTVRLDLTEHSTWPRALSRARRLFLALPEASPIGRIKVREFLEQAVSAGVDHVVILSSAGTQQGTPHWEVEADVDDVGLARTFLRPVLLHQQLADAYGDDIAFHNRLRMPIGHGRIACVDARDVARVAALTLVAESPAPRSTYTLTGQESLSGTEVAALFSRVLGRDITFEPISLVRSDLPLTASRLLTTRGTTDPTLRLLLRRPPTTLADYVAEHRSRWVAPVG